MGRVARDADVSAFEELYMLAAPRVLLLGTGADEFTTTSSSTAASSAGVKANMSLGSVTRLVRRAAARRAAQTFVRDAAHTTLLPVHATCVIMCSLCACAQTLRSFLKLYTTIPVSKLARFLDVDVDACRTQLLAYKQQSRVMGACATYVSACV
jgi:hypothetical protein